VHESLALNDFRLVDYYTLAPLTRYNLMSNRLYNPFDNRLYRVNGVLKVTGYTSYHNVTYQKMKHVATALLLRNL